LEWGIKQKRSGNRIKVEKLKGAETKSRLGRKGKNRER